jgi:DNA-binding NtrC family response regulator
MIESVVVMHAGSEIELKDLPSLAPLQGHDTIFSLHMEGRQQIPLDQTLATFEHALLDWALKKASGNQAQAAKLLDIPRSTFQYRWLKNLEQKPQPEPAPAD